MDLEFKVYDEFDKRQLLEEYNKIFESINYILISPNSPLSFFGYFYMNLKKQVVLKEDIKIWKSDKVIESGIVYIHDDTLVVVADLKNLNKKDYLFKLLYYILHEILHVVLKHHKRFREGVKDNFLFQLAADQVVNTIIQQFYHNKDVTHVNYFPPNELFIPRYGNKNYSLDEMYNIFKNKNEFEIKSKRIKIPLKNNLLDLFEVVPDDTEKDNYEIEDIKDQQEINEYFKTEIRFEINSQPEYKSKDVINIEESNKKINELGKNLLNSISNKKDIEFDDISILNETDSLINSIQKEYKKEYLEYISIELYDKIDKKTYSVIYNISKDKKGFIDKNENKGAIIFKKYKEHLIKAFNNSRGFDTSDGLAFLDQFFKVKYPWDSILKNAINLRAVKINEFSFARPNIKRMNLNSSSNVMSPGRIKHEKPHTAVFIVDTSASMSYDQLSRIASIIRSSCGKYNEIIIITHDEAITDIIIIKNGDSLKDLEDNLKHFKGRGGTSHKDVFEKLEEFNKTHQLSTIMFFTDYYSDVESIYKKYKFMYQHKTFWGIVGNFKNYNIMLNLNGVSAEAIIIEE